MKKNEYSKPLAKVFAMETQQIIATSFDTKDTYSEKEDLTQGRRGEWGDLWSNGTEE